MGRAIAEGGIGFDPRPFQAALAQAQGNLAQSQGNDGTQGLSVTFDLGTDGNMDQVNVQNRVAQATSQLPPNVNQYGVTIRKSFGSR